MDTNQLLQSPTPRNCHVNLNSFVGASLKFSPMMTWTPRDKNDTQLPLVTPVSRCICIHNTHDAHLFPSHSDPALDLFRQQVEEKVDTFYNFHPIDQDIHDENLSSFHPDPALDVFRQQVEEKVDPFDNFHPIDQDIHDEYLSSFHPDPALDLFRQQVEEKVDPFDNFHPIDQDIHDEYLSSFHPDPAWDLFRQQVEEKVNGFTFTRNNKARSIQVGDVIVDKPMDLFDEADSLEDYFDSDCEYSL
jgi:stalled ribosome alternative rescue factor ArfA